MSRRRRATKRPVQPDIRYQSTLVSHLINSIMECGKKSVAQRIVYGAFEKASEKLEPGKKEWHKNAFWGEVTKSEKAVGQYALVVTDIMGRLEKAEVKFFAADGSISAAKVECERGRFRGVWRIDTEGGKHVPARYEAELPAPTFYVERAVKVTVSHP